MATWSVLWLSACVTITTVSLADDATDIPVSVSILRYRAVLDELEVSDSQQARLKELVASFDREKTTRKHNAKQVGHSRLPANASIEQVLALRADWLKRMTPLELEYTKKAKSILTDKQYSRLEQLSLQNDWRWLHLLPPSLSTRLCCGLDITDAQIEQIMGIVVRTRNRPWNPKKDFRTRAREAVAVRNKAREDILAILTEDQRQKLRRLTGKEFDWTQLYSVPKDIFRDRQKSGPQPKETSRKDDQ